MSHFIIIFYFDVVPLSFLTVMNLTAHTCVLSVITAYIVVLSKLFNIFFNEFLVWKYRLHLLALGYTGHIKECVWLTLPLVLFIDKNKIKGKKY